MRLDSASPLAGLEDIVNPENSLGLISLLLESRPGELNE
jgi:hypothetical protein